MVEETAKCLDIDLVWQGTALTEQAIDVKTGKTIVAIDPKYFRPAEVDLLLGDASKAKHDFAWEPQVKFC